MSFFEDKDPAPQRDSTGGSGGAAADRQTLLVRRSIAIGAGLLVVVLLVLGIRSCFDTRKERDFQDYADNAKQLLAESNQQSKELFKALQGRASDQPVGIENALNTLSQNAARNVDRARKLDHPDQFNTANAYLIQILEFRRDGLRAIAAEAPKAGQRGSRTDAAKKIAGEMRLFDASDVMYVRRFYPAVRKALAEEELENRIGFPRTPFLPNIDWLQPEVVLERVSGIASGASGNGSQGPAAPGTHGNGLGTVTVQPGGEQLTEEQAADIKAGSNVSFDVEVENQAENDEKNVKVTVEITGGGKPIKLEDSLPSIAAGETKTASIPLAQNPPTGRALEIKVTVADVPGEEDSSNNTATYPAIFTRG